MKSSVRASTESFLKLIFRIGNKSSLKHKMQSNTKWLSCIHVVQFTFCHRVTYCLGFKCGSLIFEDFSQFFFLLIEIRFTYILIRIFF